MAESKGRILIVDDEANARGALSEILREDSLIWSMACTARLTTAPPLSAWSRAGVFSLRRTVIRIEP